MTDKKAPSQNTVFTTAPVANRSGVILRTPPKDPGEYCTEEERQRIHGRASRSPTHPSIAKSSSDPEKADGHSTPARHDQSVAVALDVPNAFPTASSDNVEIRQGPEKPTPPWIVDITDPDISAGVDRCEGFTLRVDDRLGFDLDRWMNTPEPERTKNRYPKMPEELFKAFVESVRLGGVHVPVTINRNSYQVVDGNHRLEALHLVRKEGDNARFAGFVQRDFASHHDEHDFQDEAANLTRQLTQRERREKIREALLRHPDWTDGRIAKRLFGVDGETVAAQSKRIGAAWQRKRPTRRLADDDRWIDVEPAMSRALPATAPPEKKPAVESSALLRLVKAWAKAWGVYMISAVDVARMMATDNKLRPDEIVIDADNPAAAATPVAEWLNRIAVGKVIAGHLVFARDAANGLFFYQLIPDGLRIRGVEQAPGPIVQPALSQTTGKSEV